ncbi:MULTISPECIES: ABC transporter ATP-binding protein [unclassified Paenibacillus]|uniref:ABC transporter ATP-binding protein n=1 Tax=unclassified Paenibacillus TaxID=185978 RepID=UPI002404B54E|nr:MULTISPECIES: ABC transporter ATP-binding protein [unclassified Paenibacillus]MDF9845313.1 ATP-binding cassette subfamily B multidrug efflux pump [Paenibacillus sp. PastF-2]MDF9851895.1 ATP-binding cassette subfamily B multidrug efflux pump [Paenibacillus sp. PastM-2]MDF9858459.1 ATP-binding cassette subfamily B multidrug efflux pump [Paenibacillus sp. PastF-1]MDH6483726.1 ATP-binding cassette subfamily B multidrug efflux pump [Paenibacillus sp. PastH-2]MDH6511108.1 ATP-binding cassette sub
MFELKWLWQNLQGNRTRYILALCLSVVGSALTIVNPYISQRIVDTFIAGDQAVQNLTDKRGLLIALCLGMIGFSLLRTGLAYLTTMQYERSSQNMMYNIRIYLYNKIQGQDREYYDRNRTGDLMTKMTGDLDMVRHSMAWIFKTIIESVTIFAAAVIYFFTIDAELTLWMLILAPPIFIVAYIFAKRVRPMYIDLRERLSQLNTTTQENISGNRVVKAFAREAFEIEKFTDKNINYSTANKKAALVWLDYFPYLESFAQAFNVILMIAGGLFLIDGRITFGEFAAFSSLIWAISNPMRNIGIIINDIQRFFASLSKIVDIYYAKPSIANEHNPVQKRRYEGRIEFQNVRFKYDSALVLDDVSFTVEPGETVAIMGSTGAGKTTIINLIPRFYDVTSGRVLVDGVDVRDLELDELRGNIGMATQDVLLFSDTIDGNIAYGDPDLPEEDAMEYARLAAAHDFITKMPEGYDTVVGERGVGLSGGQKQRIALARALAVHRPILILDDTTSAVDLETEEHIQRSLRELEYPCTKIIIAQRVSTTCEADRILIIDRGRLIEEGTHAELLAKRGYYYEVFMLQNEGIGRQVSQIGQE